MSEKKPRRPDARPFAPGEDGPVATSSIIPKGSDPDQQRRIDELLTDSRYRGKGEPLKRPIIRTRSDMVDRLGALTAEAEEDHAETGGEDRYLEVQRSNQEARESLAAAEDEAAAVEAAAKSQQRTKTRRRAGSGGASRSGGKGSRKPRSARSAYEPTRRGSLPRLSMLGKDEAALPGFPNADSPEPDSQMLLPLPGIADTVHGSVSWLLWLFDRAGGDSWKGGRGAPWPLRLFVYALLHLDVAYRDGEWHTVRVKTEKVIEQGRLTLKPMI